jgi:hypothetical protein
VIGRIGRQSLSRIPLKRVALFGAAASVPASFIVMYCARQLSVPFFLFWLLVLAPPGAGTASLLWAISRRRALSIVTRVLLGAVIGTVLVYVEAFIFGAIRSDLLPDPMALSNIVPGVVIGVLANYFVFRLDRAAAEH